MPSISVVLIVMAMLIQLVVSPYASANTSPAQGDLAVYSVGYHSSSVQAPGPVLFLLLDPALYTTPNHTQHLQYLQHALDYLMDTPGLMADNLQLGIGKVTDVDQGETAAELVLVPVAALGQVADSHHPKSQRHKIKNFIKDQCPQFPNCRRQHTGDDDLFISSMAAYAQASAYMMGTDNGSRAVNKANRVNKASRDGRSSETDSVSLDDIEIVDIGNTSSQLPVGQPSIKANNEPVALMDIEPAFSISNAQKLYSKPIYNQCSARHFETEALDALAYSVGNAVVIITADSDSAALISSGPASPMSNLDPLAMMTQSLIAKYPSSTRGDLAYQQYILQQCHSQSLSSTSNPTAALSPNLIQTLGTEGDWSNKALSWRCVQNYARHLNQFKAANVDYHNPLGIALKTAVIAFSNADNALNVVGENKGLPSYDCLAATVAPSIRQKCLLGQYGHNYGEGGFFQSVNTRVGATSEQGRKQSVELAQALIIMAKNLTTQPSAMARKAPFQMVNFMHGSELFKKSYQTYLQPQFGSLQAQWPGGVSKYQSSVVNNIFAAEVIKNKRQLLKNPRNIYLSQAETGELIAQTTESINRFQLPKLTPKQQLKLRQSLLSYMFDASPPSGGIHHSTPIALISKAQPLTSNQSSTINLSESTKYSYKKHILYGAMDNALHIIDEATGEEIAAYFAKEVLAENGQYQAIRQDSLAASTEAHPSFGIDGPWTQYARYITNAEGESIAKPLYVFGGARLGARAYYGLDLTGLDRVDSAHNLNGFAPKQLFTITPDRQDFGQQYFKQLAYSWSKPVITHINWFGVPKLVAILSGGYDANEYDKPDGLRERHYLQQGQQSILGNAIYIVDAKTGVPLIVATADNETQSIIGSNDDNGFSDLSKDAGKVLQVANASMLYSITGSVKAMDREEDGLTDHLYFADLEGQLFRLDIDNVASSPALASKVRVVRLADFRRQKNSPGPRFYETPVVTLQNHNAVDSRSSKFATVSVASGDRSHPLRITDPTKHTVSLEIEYLDSLGHRQILQAVHKQFLTTDDAGVKLESSKWQLIASDLALTSDIDNNSDIRFDNGQFQLATKLFMPGSLLKATTTFASTDKISASLRVPSSFVSISPSQSLPAIADPLAPILSVTKYWIGIKPMTTEKMSVLSRTANHVYTLYDKDVANPALFNTPVSALQTRDIYLTEENFPDLPTIDVSNPQFSGYQKQGWRSPLTQFGQHHANFNKAGVVEKLNNQDRVSGSNSLANALAIKAFGPMFAVSNKLYLTAYNPVPKSQPLAACRAQLIGNTEVYQFCLPYGNCNTANKVYRSHVQRIGYGNGLNPLSWKTVGEGKARQLFIAQVSGIYSEANPTEETHLSILVNLNDIQAAPKFVNSFTLQPKLQLEQWFDYSNHLSVSD
ncbi:hypothetical protein [Psychrobacter phenylpyruvicus]|uniref:Tfp pilus assembly protein, tip-associated adhesin PilY1 n=1 Tax=Psychrobacter phenylpyruvicus TaxID=29432 RepID=A0A379LHC8_9GAMM|nr:hypothetical protein [Psychrobacter phenylpyruvicus]SUD89938.1 Tfp pilus assembly protein, tip-associated adhesin PilY1 [Psychrobacter phenylpyruvicus]